MRTSGLSFPNGYHIQLFLRKQSNITFWDDAIDLNLTPIQVTFTFVVKGTDLMGDSDRDDYFN